MALRQGTHTLGPDNATLTVHTGRTGAAAKAGHDLLIEVTAWQASLTAGEGPDDTAIEMTVDTGSLRVREGHGGMHSLSDEDKLDIQKTIDEEVLHREQLTFRSTAVAAAADGSGLHVEGELSLHGTTHALAVDVVLDSDGGLSAETVVKQSDWGIKPYSTLYGALKVADDVQIRLAAKV